MAAAAGGRQYRLTGFTIPGTLRIRQVSGIVYLMSQHAPGRPAVGPATNIRFDPATVAALDAARGTRPRAALVRELVDEALAARTGVTMRGVLAHLDQVIALAAESDEDTHARTLGLAGRHELDAMDWAAAPMSPVTQGLHRLAALIRTGLPYDTATEE